MDLSPLQLRILESAVALAAFVALRLAARSFIRAKLMRSVLKRRDTQEVRRLATILPGTVLAILVGAIWGVDQSEILIFATAVITALGWRIPRRCPSSRSLPHAWCSSSSTR